jgi:hypothetical protein
LALRRIDDSLYVLEVNAFLLETNSNPQAIAAQVAVEGGFVVTQRSCEPIDTGPVVEVFLSRAGVAVQVMALPKLIEIGLEMAGELRGSNGSAVGPGKDELEETQDEGALSASKRRQVGCVCFSLCDENMPVDPSLTDVPPEEIIGNH